MDIAQGWLVKSLSRFELVNFTLRRFRFRKRGVWDCTTSGSISGSTSGSVSECSSSSMLHSSMPSSDWSPFLVTITLQQSLKNYDFS